MGDRAELSNQAADIVVARREKRLAKHGLTRTYYMQKLRALCECTKPISCIKGKEADGGTVDFVDVPDNAVQLNAIKEVIALYGDRAAEKKDIKQSGELKIEIVDYSKAGGE
jgi:hypothetical protein